MNNHQNTTFYPFGDFIKTCASGSGTGFNNITKWVKSVILLIIPIYAKVSLGVIFFETLRLCIKFVVELVNFPKIRTFTMKTINKIFGVVLSIFMLLGSNVAYAESAQAIDIKVKATLNDFREKILGGTEFLESAKGVLIFPEVLKAGFGIGGEYGEGALLIDNKTADYYNTVSASIGLQFGVQTKSVIVVFLTQQSLSKFRSSDGWEAGVDGSIAVLEWGAGKDIKSAIKNNPIVGFVLNNKGLMYNLTIEGSKFSKISP